MKFGASLHPPHGTLLNKELVKSPPVAHERRPKSITVNVPGEIQIELAQDAFTDPNARSVEKEPFPFLLI